MLIITETMPENYLYGICNDGKNKSVNLFINFNHYSIMIKITILIKTH